MNADLAGLMGQKRSRHTGQPLSGCAAIVRVKRVFISFGGENNKYSSCKAFE